MFVRMRSYIIYYIFIIIVIIYKYIHIYINTYINMSNQMKKIELNTLLSKYLHCQQFEQFQPSKSYEQQQSHNYNSKQQLYIEDNQQIINSNNHATDFSAIKQSTTINKLEYMQDYLKEDNENVYGNIVIPQSVEDYQYQQYHYNQNKEEEVEINQNFSYSIPKITQKLQIQSENNDSKYYNDNRFEEMCSSQRNQLLSKYGVSMNQNQSKTINHRNNNNNSNSNNNNRKLALTPEHKSKAIIKKNKKKKTKNNGQFVPPLLSRQYIDYDWQTCLENVKKSKNKYGSQTDTLFASMGLKNTKALGRGRSSRQLQYWAQFYQNGKIPEQYLQQLQKMLQKT